MPEHVSTVVGTFGGELLCDGEWRFDEIDAISHIAAERWYGTDRHKTAADIADSAISEGWVTAGTIGLASTMPDGLSSGPKLGQMGGVFMPTARTTLPTPTRQWLDAHKASVASCYVFGENDVVSDAVCGDIQDALDYVPGRAPTRRGRESCS